MNYLAHFYLSFEQEALIVGNLLGDFVRGRLDHPRNAHYHEGIKTGILLHRHIDSFTDTHPIAAQCRRLLPSTFAGYSGVVMDMYFDHFLAKNFVKYTPQYLPEFTANVYQILNNNRQHIPDNATPLLDSMIRYDWLANYALPQGMERSFVGMSRKYSFLKGIENATQDLQNNGYIYEPLFFDFFEELTDSCRNFLEE